MSETGSLDDKSAAKARMAWTFDRNLHDAANRQARALEYIAMYLDGIEASMSKIAREIGPIKSQGDGKQLTEGLAFQLQALANAARAAGGKP